MAATSSTVFTIDEAEKFGFRSGTICISFVFKGDSLECSVALSRWYSSLRQSNYPDELKSATLIRCCHAKVREYLQLTVTDSTTYGDITEAILSYDAACKVLKSLTQGAERRWTYTYTWKLTESTWTKERQGERKVQRKRKGGEWTSAWGYLRGKGRGRGLKGKGKDRGKPKGKRGKSKRKNKGKGKLGQNQCSDHLQSGHGARDCPNKMRVEQSDQGQQQQQPSQEEMLNHSFLEDEADHAVLQQQVQATQD